MALQVDWFKNNSLLSNSWTKVHSVGNIFKGWPMFLKLCPAVCWSKSGVDLEGYTVVGCCIPRPGETLYSLFVSKFITLELYRVVCWFMQRQIEALKELCIKAGVNEEEIQACTPRSKSHGLNFSSQATKRKQTTINFIIIISTSSAYAQAQ